uniref:WH2 domain-containing protein n=1 Tax=Rhabditophanes sp. KR3021 TaxID=114890 RepID=A0AC35UC45_9BILA
MSTITSKNNSPENKQRVRGLDETPKTTVRAMSKLSKLKAIKSGKVMKPRDLFGVKEKRSNKEIMKSNNSVLNDEVTKSNSQTTSTTLEKNNSLEALINSVLDPLDELITNDASENAVKRNGYTPPSRAGERKAKTATRVRRLEKDGESD